MTFEFDLCYDSISWDPSGVKGGEILVQKTLQQLLHFIFKTVRGPEFPFLALSSSTTFAVVSALVLL